jgi:hypothetical protein
MVEADRLAEIEEWAGANADLGRDQLEAYRWLIAEVKRLRAERHAAYLSGIEYVAQAFESVGEQALGDRVRRILTEVERLTEPAGGP